MDAENINNSNWKSKAGTYFEVTTGQIFHLGQAVLYKGKKLWIYKVSMVLKQGVLQCVYQLAEKEHRIFSTFYNPKLKGNIIDWHCIGTIERNHKSASRY